jgi:hypothetical protein
LLQEELPFAAKNVLVIAEADRVVLKGQVRSQEEALRKVKLKYCWDDDSKQVTGRRW